jgi:hypothetical protein
LSWKKLPLFRVEERVNYVINLNLMVKRNPSASMYGAGATRNEEAGNVALGVELKSVVNYGMMILELW